MSVTPQTNTTLEEIAVALLERDQICICGHVSPDGDCVGSQTALALALKSAGKTVTCLKASPEPLDNATAALPGASDMVFAGDFKGACDTFIAVDVPNHSRMGAAAQLHQDAAFTVTIDHHAYHERVSDLSYTDPAAPATALLVWQLIKLLGVVVTREMATSAYAGLMTDTGRFRHSNTTSEAFAQAADMVACGADAAVLSQMFFDNRSVASVRLEGVLIDRMRLLSDGAIAISWIALDDMERFGAVKADCEPLIDVLRCMRGVRVACVLREQPSTGGVRGSFRAKDDTDVAAIAAEFGGGGHKAAAGFSLTCALSEAVRIVEQRLLDLDFGRDS